MPIPHKVRVLDVLTVENKENKRRLDTLTRHCDDLWTVISEQGKLLREIDRRLRAVEERQAKSC